MIKNAGTEDAGLYTIWNSKFISEFIIIRPFQVVILFLVPSHISSVYVVVVASAGHSVSGGSEST